MTELKARNAIIQKQPDFSSVKAPEPVMALLRKSLEKDATKRFQSAKEMKSAVEGVLGQV